MRNTKTAPIWSVPTAINHLLSDGQLTFSTRCFGSSMLWFAEELFELSQASTKREAFLELTDAMGILVACSLSLKGLIDYNYVSGSQPQGTAHQRVEWLTYNLNNTVQRKFTFAEWKKSFTSALAWPALNNTPMTLDDALVQLEAMSTILSAGAETLFARHSTRTNLYKKHLQKKGRYGDLVSDEVLALLRHAPVNPVLTFSTAVLGVEHRRNVTSSRLADIWFAVSDFDLDSASDYRRFVISGQVRDGVVERAKRPIHVDILDVSEELLTSFVVLHIDALVGRTLPEAYLGYLVWLGSQDCNVFDGLMGVNSPLGESHQPVSFLRFSKFFAE